jgi:hypothetical protein
LRHSLNEILFNDIKQMRRDDDELNCFILFMEFNKTDSYVKFLLDLNSFKQVFVSNRTRICSLCNKCKDKNYYTTKQYGVDRDDHEESDSDNDSSNYYYEKQKEEEDNKNICSECLMKIKDGLMSFSYS